MVDVEKQNHVKPSETLKQNTKPLTNCTNLIGASITSSEGIYQPSTNIFTSVHCC